MRYTLIFLFGLLIGGLASINIFGQNEVEYSQSLGGEWSNGQTNVNTHLAILETYEMHMTEIQKRIQRLETRLVYLANKPYRDPQGFRRDGAKRMLGNLRNEMEKVEQRIAWHRAKIWQLQVFHGNRGTLAHNEPREHDIGVCRPQKNINWAFAQMGNSVQ